PWTSRGSSASSASTSPRSRRRKPKPSESRTAAADGRARILDRVMSQSAQNAASVYRRLLGYLRPQWFLVAAAIVPATIYALLGTAVPVLMSQWVDLQKDVVENSGSAWQIPLAIAVLF